MNEPTRISTIENRNGKRQPHSRKASRPSTQFRISSTVVAMIIPIGTPICGNDPKKLRLSTGACSTAISAAPPHSPPAEKPCRILSTISSTGAQKPIWA